ncbi:MAG: glycosyltransferase family 39 protein [Pseudomonadota bacterium]
MPAFLDRAARLTERAGEAIGAALEAVLDWAVERPWRGILLAGLVALLATLPGLTTLPVTDRDEGRFVQATKQMMETGDYVDIRFQDRARWKKPIGIYWLQAGAAIPAGGVEAPIWAYRLPSFLGVILAAMGTVWAARALIPARAAVLSGVMLATVVLAAAEATIAKTDAALLLTAVLAFGALARVLMGRAERFTWLVFWLAIAGATLLKGPVVPAIAALALAGFLLARRLGGGALPALGALRPVPGLVLTAALVVPWLAAIWVISEGRFFDEAVGRDLLGKMAEGQEKHWGPPGLYSAIVWGTFWPWAAFLPAALAASWRLRREALSGAAGWLLLLAAWIVPFWLVLEVVPTKLPHYVLPLYPALAMVIAWYVSEGTAPEARWMLRLSAILAALPGLVLGLAAIALPIALEGRLVPGAAFFGLAGAVLALVAGQAALAGRLRAQAGTSVLAALMIFTAALQFGLPSLNTAFATPRLASLAEPWRACAEGPLVSVGYREPSLVFRTGTDTRLIGPEEAAEHLRAAPGALLLVEDWALRRMAEARGPDAPALISRGSHRYFNYNRGKFYTAEIMTLDDPRFTPCAGTG